MMPNARFNQKRKLLKIKRDNWDITYRGIVLLSLWSETGEKTVRLCWRTHCLSLPGFHGFGLS